MWTLQLSMLEHIRHPGAPQQFCVFTRSVMIYLERVRDAYSCGTVALWLVLSRSLPMYPLFQKQGRTMGHLPHSGVGLKSGGWVCAHYSTFSFPRSAEASDLLRRIFCVLAFSLARIHIVGIRHLDPSELSNVWRHSSSAGLSEM